MHDQLCFAECARSSMLASILNVCALVVDCDECFLAHASWIVSCEFLELRNFLPNGASKALAIRVSLLFSGVVDFNIHPIQETCLIRVHGMPFEYALRCTGDFVLAHVDVCYHGHKLWR